MSAAEQAVAERIALHCRRREPLRITGGGSKRFYGESSGGEPLSLRQLTGVSDYQPSELVLTARAATPLSEIEMLLSENGQMLPFDPPQFAGGTLGGAIACGLSGGGRMRYGAARDFVLGVTLINGRGELLRFGGQVMKNVAGYDVSRLNVGALGTLGVMTEITVKVLPRAKKEKTRILPVPPADAIAAIHRWQKIGLSPAATFYDGKKLHVRISSSADEVSWAEKIIGGEDGDGDIWPAVRDHRHSFFAAATRLWRLSLPVQMTPPVPGETVFEWNGALHWLRDSDLCPAAVRELAARAGGHACLFKRPPDDDTAVFHPMPPPLLALHRRLKNAFDPAGILNPGRLCREF